MPIIKLTQISLINRGKRLPNDYETELANRVEHILKYFPKIKLESMSRKEIEEYAEKFLQVHSLRCKNCVNGFKCYKAEMLINITEIL